MNIHKNACEKVDKLTEELFSMMNEIDVDIPKEEKTIELYDVHQISSEDIVGDVIFSITMGEKIINRAFLYNEKMIGFTYDSLRKMDEIVEELYKNKDIRKLISINFLNNQIFEWCKSRYKKEKIEENFSKYIISKIEEEISDYILYIPIPSTFSYIGNFTMGHIEFVVFTEEMIEDIIKIKSNFDEKTKNSIEELRKQIKKEYQGVMCAIYKGKGEKEKVRQIAYEHLSDVLSFLRVFSSPNVNPEQVSISYEYGNDALPKYKYFIVKDEDTEVCSGLQRNINDFYINKLIKDILNSIIGINYDKVLKEENLTNYQKLLINSINVYSKNTLKYDISDKIMYMLSALESMLLRNDTEPIIQNISERLAFLIGKSLEERKKIIKNVKEIYNIRSKFVHHGIQFVTEYDTVKEFMNNVFLAFIELISMSYIYQTKDDFIRDLEDKKLR